MDDSEVEEGHVFRHHDEVETASPEEVEAYDLDDDGKISLAEMGRAQIGIVRCALTARPVMQSGKAWAIWPWPSGRASGKRFARQPPNWGFFSTATERYLRRPVSAALTVPRWPCAV